jgi:hypothetical protein
MTMLRPLFPPVAHLPLDHPRVDPVAPFGQYLLGDLGYQLVI